MSISSSQQQRIDFLFDLAANNPDSLDDWRQKEINRFIENSSYHQQKRLRGLQFTIDSELKFAKNPIDSCIRISRLMQNSFSELNTLLNIDTLSVVDKYHKNKATIIPFKINKN